MKVSEGWKLFSCIAGEGCGPCTWEYEARMLPHGDNRCVHGTSAEYETDYEEV
jgi:hypothetical protein